MRATFLVLPMVAAMSVACSGSSTTTSTSTGTGGAATTATGAANATAASGATTAATGASSTGTSTTTTAASTGAGMMPPTPAQLLALTTSCNQISNGLYKMSGGGTTANIPVCGLNGAVFWTSGMAVDCDGKTTMQCSITTDPSYQNQTSVNDSMGNPLDAANLPYIVIPLASSRFDYSQHGIKLGQIAVVLYNGKLTYGVFGDAGPSADIGEASYAMASSLGIDPNPSTGGTSNPVTYIVFTGASGVAAPIEDHAATVTTGQTLAAALLLAN